MDQTATFKRLGRKTLALFIVKKSGIFFITLALILIVFFVSRFLPTSYSADIALAYPYLFLALLVFLVSGISAGWLQYTHYSLELSDADIKITTGLITQEQTGIPYRRIKEVKIERSPVDIFWGLSDVTIVVQGDEDAISGTSTHVVLPHLDKDLAQQVQNKILGRAQVEEMQINR